MNVEQNNELLQERENPQKQIEEIYKNLKESSPEFIKAELDSPESYKEFSKSMKENILKEGELDRSNIFEATLIQRLAKIEGYYSGEVDGSWCNETEKAFKLLFNITEQNQIKLSGEGLLRTTFIDGKKCVIEDDKTIVNNEAYKETQNIGENQDSEEINTTNELESDSESNYQTETRTNTDEMKLNNKIEIEENKTNELIENQINFFENNESFSEFQEYIRESENNGIKVLILDKEIYASYLRYEDNKEPLIKALGASEINQAKQELEDRKKAVASSMQYTPENMDDSYEYSYNQYEDKVEKIIEKYTPIAEKLNKLLKTDAGKILISNTAFSSFETKLKDDINTNLGYEKNSETEIATTIENNTKTLLGNINKISLDLAKEIKEFQTNQENLKQRDYITWERILYQDIPNKYETLINNQITDYALNIGKNLITAKSSVISEGKIFNLPIGNGENVKLDFSSLKGVNLDNENEALQAFRDNFSAVYRNTIGEKINDIFSGIWKSIKENPTKTAIDIGSIIASGLGAVLISKGTFGAGIPVAGLSFTILDNTIRAGAYEAFDIKGGYKAGLGIEENDTHQDVLRKKLFELGGNTLLFGIFRGTGFLEKKFLPNLEGQVKSLAIKTPVEALGFTYYSVVSENLQNTVKNDGNIKELQNDFSEISNFDALLKSYVYNLGFITAVKTGAIPAERLVIAGYQKQLNKELEILKSQNIVIVNTGSEIAFYRGNTKLEGADLKGFERFVELNKKVNYIAIEQYRKPESGRGGKSAYSTNFREEKFRKLEEYSKEAQSGKIDYALNDKTIGETLTSSGIQGGKGVGEGLLKKSGFDKQEIIDYKEGKLKGEKQTEKRALSEMERANEVIWREYKKIETSYLEGGFIIEKNNYSNDIVNKIMLLIKKENQSYKKEDI